MVPYLKQTAPYDIRPNVEEQQAIMKKFMLAAIAALLAAMSASAAPVVFTFGDHPNANLTTQLQYGLRLDGVDLVPGAGPTWSVGNNLPGSMGGPLSLIYDPMDIVNNPGTATALISGTVYSNMDGSLWSVFYTLSGLSLIDGLAADPQFGGGFLAQAGNGTLSMLNGSVSFNLFGKSDGTSVFAFNNIGHRLPGNPGVGWVGEGWLDPNQFPGSDPHGYNDFLMTATPGPPTGGEEVVPEPGTIGLMLIGLGMLVGGRTFRRTRKS